MAYRIVVEQHTEDDKGDVDSQVLYEQMVEELNLQAVIKAVNEDGNE